MTEEGSKPVVKPRDSWWTTMFPAKAANALARNIADTGITPNQITIASALIGFLSALCFASGKWLLLVIGAILLQISFILDCADGQLARLKDMCSARGAWLDLSTDTLKVFAIYFGITMGAAKGNETNNIWAWGFIAYFLSVTSMFLYATRPATIKSEDNQNGANSNNASVMENIYNTIREKAYFLSFSLPDQLLLISIFAVINRLGLLVHILVVWGAAAFSFSLIRTWRRLGRNGDLNG